MTESVLLLNAASLPLSVRDVGKGVRVFGVIPFPPDVREKLVSASSSDQNIFLMELRNQLVANGRLGFSFSPTSPVSSVAGLESVAIDCIVRIEEGNIASFNRFADAVQEISTAVFRVAVFIGGFSAAATAASTYTSSTPPPTGIYQ